MIRAGAPMKHCSPRLGLLAGLLFVSWLSAPPARADTTGSLGGRVIEDPSGRPAVGVSVLASGPRGDVATVTERDGTYLLRALPIGTYLVRFFYGDVVLERIGVLVSVEKTIRVDARLPAASAIATITVTARSPAVDVGSSRLATTLNEDFIRNTPTPLQVSEMLDRTPGAFFDPVGISIGGATGAENLYFVDGINTSGLGFGTQTTDLPSSFVEELEIISGGYNAEYGGAQGGVINIVTKSGSNDYRGSFFSQWSPGVFNGDPRRAPPLASSLTGASASAGQVDTGIEVGGPVVKDRLFFWAGYAPGEARESHLRYADAFVDANRDGVNDTLVSGRLATTPIYRQSIPGKTERHQYAAKLSFVPFEAHSLQVGIVGAVQQREYLRDANRDVRSGRALDDTSRTDVSARWLSRLFGGAWRIEANLGLHVETLQRKPLFADTLNANDVIFFNSPSLASVDLDPAVQAACMTDLATGWNPCPVPEYRAGGFGFTQDTTATRFSAELKSTHTFFAGGRHELKYGTVFEHNRYEDARANSGPPGSRAQVWLFDGGANTVTTFRVPPGASAADPAAYLSAPLYRDVLEATTKVNNVALFGQDSYSPLPNLTINAGVRWESQMVQDYLGERALAISDSIAPRLGVVFDPTNAGHARLFGNYGRFYQSMPMNLANRGFGGEGLLYTDYGDQSGCTTPIAQWGNGNPATSWRTCSPRSDSFYPIGGDSLTVQKKIRGSFMDEIVLGGEYEVLEDLVLGASYINRRLGRIIEDAGGIVANPADIPGGVVKGYQADAARAQAVAAASGSAADQAAADQASFLADTVGAVARFPKPERTYNALLLTMRKRFSRRWLAHASYTYARLRGNFTGAYASDNNQLDPNFTTQFDQPDLLINRKGPLPNDRPHQFRLDGYYTHPLGKFAALTSGLGFVARSGQPQNALAAHPDYGPGEAFLLPRGAMGRTPLVTRFDLHVAYRTDFSQGTGLEVFVDVFNLLNQRTVLSVDNNYTFDTVAPVVGGDRGDLAHVKNDLGLSPQKNPNFLAPKTFQAPISGRMGVRLTF